MDERRKKSEKIGKWGLYGTIGFFVIVFGLSFIIGQFFTGFKGLIIIFLFLAASYLFLWIVGYLPTWLQVIAYSIGSVLVAYILLEERMFALIAGVVVAGYLIVGQYKNRER